MVWLTKCYEQFESFSKHFILTYIDQNVNTSSQMYFIDLMSCMRVYFDVVDEIFSSVFPLLLHTDGNGIYSAKLQNCVILTYVRSFLPYMT